VPRVGARSVKGPFRTLHSPALYYYAPIARSAVVRDPLGYWSSETEANFEYNLLVHHGRGNTRRAQQDRISTRWRLDAGKAKWPQDIAEVKLFKFARAEPLQPAIIHADALRGVIIELSANLTEVSGVKDAVEEARKKIQQATKALEANSSK